MKRWLEPIKHGVSITPIEGVDYGIKPAKNYREHIVDEVLAGIQTGPYFQPTHRVQRHFIDRELVESVNTPLKPGDHGMIKAKAHPIDRL